MNCQHCTHWNLKGSPLRADGFGLCKADRSQFATARTFSAGNLCRLNKFSQAEPATVAARERALV